MCSYKKSLFEVEHAISSHVLGEHRNKEVLNHPFYLLGVLNWTNKVEK